MSIQALQEYTRVSKYARYIPEENRRETWIEQVDRVFDMHEQKFSDKLPEIKEDFDFVKRMVMQKRVLGSQRALQFGGDPIIKKNARLYNCTVSYCDRPRFFQESMFLLLCGCGVGFSVQSQHIAKLPKIKERTKGTKTYVIPDSIEGWADAIGVLMSSYFVGDVPFPEYKGYTVNFDYSLIRPAGAPISFGSKAPGPDGLRNSIIKIQVLLNKCIKFNNRLRSIDAYDVIMHSSDAVLSGGVRRSATICIFSPEDDDMRNAKVGAWRRDNPQRGRSNNSALLVRDDTPRELFAKLMESVKEFGEPGFIWTDNREALYNPCVEIGMRAYDDDGNSGWQFCLTGDTLVQTDRGYIRIDELENNINVVSTFKNDNKGINDLTDNIIVPASVFNTGIKDVYEIRTKSGPILKATANHSLLTQRGYVRVSDLVVGTDMLISANETLSNDKVTYDIKDYKPNNFDLLGWNLGDGWCSGDNSFGIVFGSEEDNIAEKKLVPLFETFVNEIDGGNYGNRYGNIKFDIDKDSKVRTYNITNKNKKEKILSRWGLSNGRAHDKNIMKSYWTSSKDDKARYISSLFCADGSVINKNGNKRISITIANEDLASSLQIALTEFGITSRVTNHKRKRDNKNQSILYIGHRDDITLFKNKIGFRIHPRKQTDLNNITWEKNGSSKRGLFKLENISYLGREPVYDISANSTHNFNANGLVVHNCNLCEINMKKANNEEKFLESCKAAAILGTMQASYDNFPYLGEVTNNIVKREALLGVSMTGMADVPEIAFDPKIQRKGAKLILEVNDRLAPIIGVNRCARATCVKPAGTTSCILGTASGIHPHHARRYFRRVQANNLEAPLKFFKNYNPTAVENSVWSNGGTDQVITFLCEVPDGAKTKNDVDALTLLENVRLTQQNWVEYGTRKDTCAEPWLRHNVSNTINVKPDEWDKIESFIYRNRGWFAGISILPMSGDKDYPQSPFTAVYTPYELVREYGDASVLASGLIVAANDVF